MNNNKLLLWDRIGENFVGYFGENHGITRLFVNKFIKHFFDQKIV